MNRFRLKCKKAFTLIELLVVIAIIALLAAILAPAVTKALLNGQVTQTIANGRSLYTLLFSKQMDNPLQLATTTTSASWPTSEDYPSGDKTSSDFFATIVTNAAFNLSYNFFTASGVKAAPDLAAFTSGTELHNAWCITLDVDDRYKASTPVLFTQNIILTGKDISQFTGLKAEAKPFGVKAAVIVGYGGNAYKIDQDTALATNFNPVGTVALSLYPAGGENP